MHTSSKATESALRLHRVSVLQVVDEAYATTGSLPPGAIAQVHRAVDALRVSEDALGAMCSESIALGLHRLQYELLNRESNRASLAEVRVELRRVATDWLRAIPMRQLGGLCADERTASRTAIQA
jgi:hypothetical protein